MKKSSRPYTKYYFEAYALLNLIKCYDEKYKYLYKSESPDWQSDDLDIGLEVCQAIDTNEAVTSKITQEFFNRGHSGDFIKSEAKKKYPKYEGHIDSSMGIAVISAHGLLYNFSIHLDNIKKNYLEKTKKLNKNYKIYEENLLYIFTFENMINRHDIIKCFDIDLTKYKHNFDKCFVSCVDVIYVCDFLKKKIIEEIKVPDSILKEVKAQAIKLSNN